jgi:hypothetical protein
LCRLQIGRDGVGVSMTKEVLAIDPGLSGAFVYLKEKDGQIVANEQTPMPLDVFGKDKRVNFDRTFEIILSYSRSHVFLERAMAMAMGAKYAFNYGRDFAHIEIAIKLSKNSMTMVEPARWTKIMHAGVSSDLKPKPKSALALKRLAPRLFKEAQAASTKGQREGFTDAYLIALYGLRQL